MEYFTGFIDGLIVFWDAIPGWWEGFKDMVHTFFLVMGVVIVFVIYAKFSGVGTGERIVDQYISKD